MTPSDAQLNHKQLPQFLLTAAQQYAAMGLPVFPLKPKDKRPATRNGYKDATVDRQQIAQWWAKNPEYNIGLATGGGFFVVDVDEPNKFQRLLQERDWVLPKGPRVKTCKGWHCYLSIPNGAAIKNRAGIAGCFDIRGQGGYVVAPPSLHPEGNLYQAETIITTPFPQVPEWLLGLLNKHNSTKRVGAPTHCGPKPLAAVIQTPRKPLANSRYGHGALTQACQSIFNAKQGSRNDTLNREAYSIAQLVAGGELALESATHELSLAAGQIGLAQTEIDKTLASAFNEGAKYPRSSQDNHSVVSSRFSSQPSHPQEDVWKLPELQPLPKYPLDSLGPLMGGCARAIAEYVQAPPELAAQSVLAMGALMAQQQANIEIDGRVMPLSLFCLSIAESGDRKSGCDKLASSSVYAWHKEAQELHKQSVAGHKVREEAYNNLTKKISSIIDEAEREREIEALEIPKAPIAPDVLCQEPTLEGLQKSLKYSRPSQGLFSSEGGQFFGGHAMNPDNCAKSISGLSLLWDGAPITRTRAHDDTFTMYDRRLTVHLMAQPIITDKLFTNPLLKQQGIFARFLVVHSQSLAGQRAYQAGDFRESCEIQAFHQRIDALLNEPVKVEEDGGLALPSIGLSAVAKRHWVNYYDEVEQEQAPGGQLESIKETASKSAEQVARIAGVITMMEGHQEVAEPTMVGAILLGEFYLQQALRIAQKGEVQVFEGLAAELVEWMRGIGGKADIGTIQKKSPRKLGLRKSAANARKLLTTLVKAGVLRVIETNTQNRPSHWEVMDV